MVEFLSTIGVWILILDENIRSLTHVCVRNHQNVNVFHLSPLVYENLYNIDTLKLNS